MTGAGGCHLSTQCTEPVPYFTKKAFSFAVAKHAEKFGMLLVWRHVSVTISTCGLECVVTLVSIETSICVLCEPSAPSSADKSGGTLCLLV